MNSGGHRSPGILWPKSQLPAVVAEGPLRAVDLPAADVAELGEEDARGVIGGSPLEEHQVVRLELGPEEAGRGLERRSVMDVARAHPGFVRNRDPSAAARHSLAVVLPRLPVIAMNVVRNSSRLHAKARAATPYRSTRYLLNGRQNSVS